MILYELGNFAHMRRTRVRFPSSLCGICVGRVALEQVSPRGPHFLLSVAVYQFSILTFIAMLLPSAEQSDKSGNLHTKWSFGA